MFFENMSFFIWKFREREKLSLNEGGEGLPLAPKQVAPRIVTASSAASLRFVACPLPFLLGLRPKTRMVNCFAICYLHKKSTQLRVPYHPR